jgi:DNA-binding transcriptional regulator YhcF (GntR family)
MRVDAVADAVPRRSAARRYCSVAATEALPSTSSMMIACLSSVPDFQIDRADPLPLHEQVAGEIRRAIADGEARAGERLPPARDLAAVLGVNSNTVFRALRLLRDEGLLEFRRGRGITVVGTPEQGAVLARVKELVKFARRHGYRRDDLIKLIENES